jgi:hypothetical protein
MPHVFLYFVFCFLSAPFRRHVFVLFRIESWLYQFFPSFISLKHTQNISYANPGSFALVEVAVPYRVQLLLARNSAISQCLRILCKIPLHPTNRWEKGKSTEDCMGGVLWAKPGKAHITPTGQKWIILVLINHKESTKCSLPLCQREKQDEFVH